MSAAAVGTIAAGIAPFIVAGFFLCVARVPLTTSMWIAVLLAIPAGFVLRERQPLHRIELLLIACAALVGSLVYNDVYNKDILWQVAFAEEARYFNTLLLPGFYSTGYSTKYDGWIFLLGGVSRLLHVEPLLVLHAANIVLFPVLTYIACRAARLLGLSPIHVPGLLACAVVFGGDGVRLISFAGPRALATLLQMSAVLHLAYALRTSSAERARPALAAGCSLVASAIAHNFFGLANALLTASAVGAGILLWRAGRTVFRTLALFSTVFVGGMAPFLWIKWRAIPSGANVVGPGESTSVQPFTSETLFSARWSEYGTLWPYWILAIVLVALLIRPPRPALREPRVFSFLAVSLLGFPLLVLLVPWTRSAISDVTTQGRLLRLLPTVPVAMAWTAYAVYAQLLNGERAGWRRSIVAIGCGLSLMALLPPLYDTARWYRHIWPATRGLQNEDRYYYAIGVYLGPFAANGCRIAAETKLDALRIASVLRGYRIFFMSPEGPLQYATSDDSFVHTGPRPDFDFVVTTGGSGPGTLAYRSGPLLAWRTQVREKCVDPFAQAVR